MERAALSEGRKVQCLSLYADLRCRDVFRQDILARAILHVKIAHRISHVMMMMMMCWEESASDVSKGRECILPALCSVCKYNADRTSVQQRFKRAFHRSSDSSNVARRRR
jgi:hypothetical protein